MKCWRVLYKPDNTAFMVWAETEEIALKKVRERNIYELDNPEEECINDYIIGEFTPKTNNIGIIAFYDVYLSFERKQ